MPLLEPGQVVTDTVERRIDPGIDTVPDGRFHDFVIRQFLFCQQGETRVVVFDFVDGEVEVVGEVLRGGLRRTRE